MCFASWTWGNIPNYVRIPCPGEIANKNYALIDATRNTTLLTLASILRLALPFVLGWWWLEAGQTTRGIGAGW